MRLLAILLICSIAGASTARSPMINPAPKASSDRLKPGLHTIDGIGTAYLPPGKEGALPLLLLFHGAGMSARNFAEGMKQEANRCGCALLAIQSQGRTWDLIGAARSGSAKAETLFGPDAGRVERGLSEIMARASIDPARVVPIGFSDGASYALSLSLFNPKLFRSAIAVAPGFVLQPALIDPSQRLFIAHGRGDKVLVFANTEGNVVAPLRKAGYTVEFRPFDGGHSIDRQSLDQGITFALGKQG